MVFGDAIFFVPAGKVLGAGDETGSIAEGEIGPGPLGEDCDSIAETDEEEDVDEEPCHPCRKAAPMSAKGPLNVGDGGLAAYGGHVALVEIVERGVEAGAVAAEVAGCETADAFGGIDAHLHGGLGYAREHPAILFNVGEVAADEDLRMTGRVEELIDEDAAAAVDGETEKLAEGRGLDACGPEGDGGFDALVADHDVAGLDIGDAGAGADLDAKGVELLKGFLLQIGWIGSEDVR